MSGFCKGNANRTTKKQSKIGTVISNAFLVLLVLVASLFVWGRISGNHVLPYSPIWVLSASMEDEIPKESYILVKYTDGDNVWVGDVITFISPDPALGGKLNTHRIVDIAEDGGFITKGDANLATDAYEVPKGNVVAVYLRNMPVLTALGRIFMNPAGLALSLLLLISGITVYSVLVLEKKVKKSDESQEK